MKIINNTKRVLHNPVGLALIILLVFLGSACQKEVDEWGKSSEEFVITGYVYDNPEQFSEFGKLLEHTGIENLLRVRGPYTLLLPTNSAMQNYYASKGVSSYTELDSEDFLSNLVYNHIFRGEISVGSMGLGALPFKNGLGNFVASDFSNIDIMLNKSAKIIKEDIPVANGYVHHIDHVLEVVTKNVFDVLSEDSGYSIFREGLVRSGIADTLKIISFKYGSIDAKTHFTLLAIPDTLYNRKGINNIDDLISKYSTDSDLTNIDNGFYKYMEYHCISGIHYFSDFTPGASGDIYYLISKGNYIGIKVEKEFKINKDSEDNYTGFYVNQSNIPAKNGVIHTINSLLPNVEAEPVEVIFQVTDYFDFQKGAFYQKNYKRFYDGLNTFEDIKWDAEYLMYYYKSEHNFTDGDGLALMGHFWIEITTPIISKGKYDLTSWMFGGGVMAWYIDDVLLNNYDMADGNWMEYRSIGEVEFTETKQHTIRIKTLVGSSLWWDHLKFTPL